MRFIVVDSTEFTYPDRWEYATASDTVRADALRGGYASFQILLDDLRADHVRGRWLPEEVFKDDALRAQADLGFPRIGGIAVETDIGMEVEWYAMVPVTVERNQNLPPERHKPHFPERIAPYRVYDCLRPFDGTLDVGVGDGREEETGIAGLYGAVRIPEDAVPGVHTGFVTVNAGAESVRIPVEITVFAARIPAETLTVIQGHSGGCMAKYHGLVPGSDEYNAMDDRYVACLRRMRQNMMYTGGVRVTKVGENRWEFDFTAMEDDMRRHFAAGMTRFNGPSVGWRQSWSASTILLNGTIPAMSYEGYCYLTQYLPALHNMLEKNGWLGSFVMGVADEPNTHNATEFRALCGLIRKIVPDIRLIDAMSYGDLHGSLDIWVPLNAEYDRHRSEIETLRQNGDEIWHYVCCGPRGDGYINRFLDYPLLSTRYLFWGNYAYNLTGYLHWASDCFQPGQDPFRQNCPEHHNTDSVCYLPAGDTHLLYPGEDGPWLSIRGENTRESAEEYELLSLLARCDKEKADEVCRRVFRSFCDVEYDVIAFRRTRRALLEAVSEIRE